jgi:hypothetical protein
MIYVWSNVWTTAIAATALGVLPGAALCCLILAVGPLPRWFLAACTAVGHTGAVLTLVIGGAATTRSLLSMASTARLVDAQTAELLWQSGLLQALVPVSSGALVGGLLLGLAAHGA